VSQTTGMELASLILVVGAVGMAVLAVALAARGRRSSRMKNPR
jgi:hypothetical protein